MDEQTPQTDRPESPANPTPAAPPIRFPDSFDLGYRSAANGEDRNPPYDSDEQDGDERNEDWLAGYDHYARGGEPLIQQPDPATMKIADTTLHHEHIRDAIDMLANAVRHDSRYDLCRQYLAEAKAVCPPVDADPIQEG